MIASSRSPPRHRRKSNIAQKQLPGGRRGACCICGIASMAQGTQVCHCEAPTGPWQSHAGSCDFADGFPVVRPCSARLPRRFAPRNDTSGERAVHQCTCAVELPSARCSGNAAAFPIGAISRFLRKKIPEAQASGSFSNTINHNQSQSIIYFAKTFFRRAKRGRPSS